MKTTPSNCKTLNILQLDDNEFTSEGLRMLLIEDHYYSRNLGDFFYFEGYKIDLAKDFIMADELLKKGKEYHIAIVDLDMDKRDLTPKIRKEAKDLFGGWAYYKYVLSQHEILKNNTIILSGFLMEFKKTKEYDTHKHQLTFIDKIDPNVKEKLSIAIGKLVGQMQN